jgi:hypothetical protein
MLHTNFGIQNGFAQGVFIFNKGGCHLILEESCGPNLTQQDRAVGCVVYVWRLETTLLCKNKESHMSRQTGCKTEAKV